MSNDRNSRDLLKVGDTVWVCEFDDHFEPFAVVSKKCRVTHVLGENTTGYRVAYLELATGNEGNPANSWSIVESDYDSWGRTDKEAICGFANAMVAEHALAGKRMQVACDASIKVVFDTVKGDVIRG